MSDSLFAHTLKEKRKSAGLSQAALASSLGVTRATVVNWEAGRGLPDLVLVPPLCRLLSLRPEALLGMSDPSDDQSEAEQLLLSQFRRLSPAGRRIVEKTAEAVLQPFLWLHRQKLPPSLSLACRLCGRLGLRER